MLVRQERTLDGKPGKVPEAAAALLRIYVRGASLQPVARLRTVRQPVELRNAAGERLAELVDDQVQVVEGRRVVDRFRELEVELGDAAQPDILDKVLARLQEAGASQAVEQLGKYRRALGDREVGAPELRVGDLDQDASVEQLLRYDLAASTMRLFGHEPGVRLGEDPEAVHQARVGVRRLRSTLRTFKPLLDQDWVGRLRDELKWLANLLGDVRDAEALHARLSRRVAGLPEGDAAAGGRLLHDLVGQRDAARERLLYGMEQRRYTALLDDLVAAVHAPAVLPEAAGLAAEASPPLVAKAWRRLRKAVKRAGETPSDEALHQIRIRAKRARYAAEAVKPVVGRPARAFAKAASNLQDELGEQHDAVVAAAWLREKASSSRGAVAIAAERAAAQAARERWRPAWKTVAGKKRTGWL